MKGCSQSSLRSCSIQIFQPYFLLYCQSAICSNPVLLCILHKEVLCFNAKFIYLNIFDLTWEFDLAE